MRSKSLCLALVFGLLCPCAPGQWVQTNGPYGGDILCLAVSGTNLFAGTLASGVFLSTDNGKSWSAVDSGLTIVSVNALAVSDTHLLAGTALGIFVSTDNGKSWTPANTGIPDFPTFLRSVNTFAVFGANIFVGTRGRMYVSTNDGASWTAVDTGLTVPPVSAFATIGTNIYAGTYGGGIFRSTNSGASWTAINTGLPTTEVWTLAIDDTNLFAGTGNGVYLTMNGGSSWRAVNSGLTETTVSVLAMAGTSLFAGTRGGIFVRNKDDTSWTAVNRGLTNLIVDALAVTPASGPPGSASLYAGMRDGGVWIRPLSEMITSVGVASAGTPAQFRLEQNYPNPFNSTTKIQFTIVNRQLTIVKVYDVLGSEVSTLVNEAKEPGTYTVQLDGSNLASGVYFYRLQAGTFVETKKLLLLR
jgi:hypothetical protein